MSSKMGWGPTQTKGMYMTYKQNNLAFAGGIHELSLDEIGFVGGGVIDAPADEPWLLAKSNQDINGNEKSSFFGDLVGTLVAAACDTVTKGTSALKCAAAGVVIATVVNNPQPTPGPAVFPY